MSDNAYYCRVVQTGLTPSLYSEPIDWLHKQDHSDIWCKAPAKRSQHSAQHPSQHCWILLRLVYEGLAKRTQHHATIFAISANIYGPQSPVVSDVNMEYVHERFRRWRRKVVACSLVLLVEDNEREVKRGKTRLWLKRRQENDNISRKNSTGKDGPLAFLLNRSSPSPSMSFLVISLSFYRIQIARHFPPCLQMTFKKASAHA